LFLDLSNPQAGEARAEVIGATMSYFLPLHFFGAIVIEKTEGWLRYFMFARRILRGADK
jgi:hypothetical protein